jgi:dolichyl-phosphate beta-glucosyltransferase
VISLVLPTYNPGPLVDRTWVAVQRFVAGQTARSDPWEALFVLDGCTDGTADRLARLTDGQDARVRVVSYPMNRGKGCAVRTGLLAARGTYRIFTDVDLAYSFADILRVADALRAGAAIAVGSRTHPRSELSLPAAVLGYAFRRHLQSRVFGAVTRALLPIAQRDTQAGLKGMTAAVAERIVPLLRCNGFGFDCELLTACARAGVAVEEVPVAVRYDTTASTTGMRATLRMLRELWQIRRRWRNRAVPVPMPLPAAGVEPARLPTAA